MLKKRDDRGSTGVVVAVVSVILALIVIPIAVWAFTVATSDVKGRGDAVVQENSANNRLEQQAYFQQTYADIKAADTKLDGLQADVKADASDKDAKVRYRGAEDYCLGLVGDYNAAAQKQIAAKFRDAGLPPQIDTTDPTTDCKPSNS